MRKFTLLFAFLLSLIGVAQAQTVITDLAQLSNGKVYTLTGERGTLLTFDGATMLYGTFAGDKAGVAYNASDPYQQFAILKSDKDNLYLYNVGTGKFVLQSEKKNPLSFDPTQTLEVVAAGSPDTANGRLWLLKVNRNMINFSGGYNEAGMCANYNEEDPGNRFCITEVGTFANETAVVAAINNYENWETTTAPTLSTDDALVYYSIKNLRQNKYAAYNTLGSALKQTNVYAEAGAVWYFVSAGDTYTNSEGKKVIPVYIKNAATDLALVSATSMSYAETGTIFYLIKHANSGKDGYVISKGDVTTNWSSWNDKSGTEVCDYKGDDAGSIWAFAPVFPTAVAAAAAGESEMFAGELTAAKTAAKEQVEALGNRDYYAYSPADVEECRTAIDAVTATTFAGIATAKEEIDACLVALKAKTPTENVLVGGEYIKFHWARDTHYYLTTDASDATSEAAANATKVLGNQVANDIRNIWQVVANSEKTGFYLYNPLSGKFIKHAAGAQLTLVADITEAGVYTFNPQNDYFWVIGGTGENDYITLASTGWAVGGKAVDNDNRANWFVEKPTETQIESLETQLATIDELKETAIEDANAQIEALNTGLEFYRYDEEKMIALKSDVAAKIDAAADRIALATAEAEVNAMIAAFINATDNRTTPISVGIKVEFVNKFAPEYYISTNNNGATTSNQTNSNVIWELVQAEGGYYLYNPLANAYVVHPTADNQQAALSATTDGATIYTIVPNGRYVNIAKVVDQVNTEDHNYLHYGADNCVVQWVANADKSLWTVTSATDTELTQLAEDIKAKVQSQYNTTLTAANNVVAPYKNRAFYVPQTAIMTYESAVNAIALPTTYAELATAEADVSQARTTFEADIAANEVEYTNKLENGTRVKFNWTRDTKYHLTTNTTLSETTSAPNATQAKGRQNAGLHAIWEVVADGETGFYLYNTLSGKYIQHPAEQGVCAALVSDKAQATAYNFKPYQDGTIKIYANDGTGENDILYINGWENVVCYDAEEQRSFFTPLKVSDDDWAAASQAVQTNISTAFSAHKEAAAAILAKYQALTYYKVTDDAVSTYSATVEGIAVPTDYASLQTAKAAVDAALLVLSESERENPLPANTRVKFVNKANPTLWMTTDAGGVTASGVVGLESHWVLKASGNGFYLYNEMSGKYVKHPAENGAQATLVSEEDQPTSYEIEPNGLFVLLKDATENTYPEDYLHYGSEGYVTRWLANHDASLWNFEVVTDDEFKELIAHQLDSCKQLALLRIGVAAKSAFYAPTAAAISKAQTSVEAVDAAAVATLADFKVAMESINAAMTTMYTDGLNNGESPQGSDKLLRLRNKLYPTHYLGFGENGLYHYETVTTENSVAPVDEDLDGEMSVGTVDILHSTESTVWALEDPIVAAADERMYLKNLMIQSYAKHQFYDGSHVQHVIEKAETSPEIIELVGVVKDANHNKTIKYEDMSFVESGEMCFVVYATEGTSNTENNAMSASERGTIVNAAHTIDASMWAISEAAEVELANMGQYSAYAFHHYVFVPTINAAKQFYCITTEGEGDAAVTTTVDYIDPVKAGYYHYTGGCVDREGVEIDLGDHEAFEQEYWYALSTAIAMDQNSGEGGHDLSKAQILVTTLNEYMKALLLNFPTRDGFFRLRCVETNAYLQSDVNTSGRCVVSNNTDVSSIFYYDAIEEEGKEGQGSLLSYRDGYYFTQGKNSQNISGIYAKLQPLGKMGDIFQFSRPQNKEFGSYNISSDNTSNQNDRRYMFGAAGNETDGYYVDNGAGATIVSVASDGDNTGYNWVMERVEELPLTINSYGYSTFYAPIALNVPEGVEAFICAGVDEKSELILQKLDVIPAGTAVILKAEELAGQVVYFTEPENTPMPLAEGENYLHGGVYKTWRTPACQNKNPEMTSATGENADLPYLDEAVGDNVYTLSNKNGKVAMYLYAGNKFTHFRSFLKMPAAVNGTLPTTFNFGDIIEGPTSIEETPVVSLEDAVIYDLSGRRVAEPGRGIYIVNGKKVYIK